jgi:hypothetical protein
VSERDPSTDDEFTRAVRQRAERLKRGRRHRMDWKSLAQVGVLAWTFLLPTLGGALLGRLASSMGAPPSARMVGLMLGLGVGAYAAWRQLRSGIEDSDGDEDPR